MLDERHLPLIEADRRRLVRAATRLLGPAEAEDAVQDAYLRALEADAPRLDAAQAWLLTVVRNLAIDRLRRRGWLRAWLDEAAAQPAAGEAPSAESDAALAEEAGRALRLLAARLDPADGAAVLLHEVFEASHAEIAQASGKSEAACRQQLRRALLRLRRPGGDAEAGEPGERDPKHEAVFQLYRQSLQARQPQRLFALLRQPPARGAPFSSSSPAYSPTSPAAGRPRPRESSRAVCSSPTGTSIQRVSSPASGTCRGPCGHPRGCVRCGRRSR
jgi:RNA polymerase sigma-70 factor (ECF subfamily)